MKHYFSVSMSSVINELNPKLEKFYNSRKDSRYFRDDFRDFAKNIMNDYFKGITDKDEIKKLGIDMRRNIARTKKRWNESLQTNVVQFANEHNARQYPFRTLYQQEQSLTKKQWERLYGGLSYEDVERREAERANAWEKDRSQFLFEYPGISSITPKRLIKAFEMDVFADEYRILEEKYALDLEHYFQPYVEGMVDAPYFSSKANKRSPERAPV